MPTPDDYSESLLLARKALATAEAACLNGLWRDAAEAAQKAAECAEQVELYCYRRMRDANP